MNNLDLWGNISIDYTTKVPVMFLKEQAALLNDKTEKFLEGKVNAVEVSSDDIVGYELNIVAPALNNFKRTILSIFHPAINFYPVNISHQDYAGEWTTSSSASEMDFIAKLREILSSPITHDAIKSLVAQSRAAI